MFQLGLLICKSRIVRETGFCLTPALQKAKKEAMMKYPLFKICFQKTLILPLVALLTSSLLIAAGCSLPNIKIFSDAGEPLKECRLQGSAAEKIAVIDITGIISDKTEKDFLGREHPSLLQ